MKINESKIKQIIAEEMAAIEDKQYFDYTDKEGGMAKRQLYDMAKYALMLHDALEDETQLESWVQSKITIASEYLSKVKHYLEYEMGLEMMEPELEMEDSEEGGCGDVIEPQGQPAEPMMVMNGEDAYEIDDELAKLMES
jgi:hypothetical protein